MLRQLTIDKLALIDHLDIAFEPGFTVLTGETGAGKSILIDALGLVLGKRADAGLVRSGANQAEVSAEFSLDNATSAVQWLQDQALEDADDPGTCLLRRVVATTGRTRAFINDRPVSLAALRELGDQLVDIFGQGESRMLVRAEVQRQFLDDSFTNAGGKHSQVLERTAAAATDYHRVMAAIHALGETAGRDPERIDYLRFQIQELEALTVTATEPQELENEQRRLAHADQLLGEGTRTHDRLYADDDSIHDQLAAAGATLEHLASLNPELNDIAATVDNARELLRDAADSLRTHLDSVNLDPERLQAVEARMAALHDMARKHHVKPAELPARLQALEAERDTLENSAEGLAQLQAEAEAALSHYRDVAAKLGQARRAAAEALAPAVTQHIRNLGMANAELSIDIAYDSEATPSTHGNNSVRFDFTANPGQAARPLAKVASGGELSRIGLALQVAGETRSGLPTLIFDEVDTGVGGSVAETVGAELAALGGNCQVLCVTHLAQVAAQGQHHLYIEKQVSKGQTYTHVNLLDQNGRVGELARMSGGHNVTSATKAHARELLGQRD